MVTGKFLALLFPRILALTLGNHQMVVDKGQNLLKPESGPDCNFLNNTKIVCTSSNSWLEHLKEYFTINLDCEKRRIVIGFSVDPLSDGDSQEILPNQHKTFDLSFFRFEIFFKVTANTTYVKMAVYILHSDKNDQPLMKLSHLIPFDLFSLCSDDTNHSIDNSTLERIIRRYLRSLKISHQVDIPSKLWLLIPICGSFLWLVAILLILTGNKCLHSTPIRTLLRPYAFSTEEKELLIP